MALACSHSFAAGLAAPADTVGVGGTVWPCPLQRQRHGHGTHLVSSKESLVAAHTPLQMVGPPAERHPVIRSPGQSLGADRQG